MKSDQYVNTLASSVQTIAKSLGVPVERVIGALRTISRMDANEVDALPVPGAKPQDDGKPLSTPTQDMWAEFNRNFPV